MDASPEELARRFKLPPSHKKHLDPSQPLPMRLMAVRGLAPMPPKVLLVVQYIAAAGILGEEAGLIEAGRNALMKAPVELLINNIDDRTHPKILEFLAVSRPGEPALDECLAVRRQINEGTLISLVQRATPRALEMITNNQELMLCFPQIVPHVAANPASSQALVDRLVGFLRVNGEDVVAEAPAAQQAAPTAPPAPHQDVATTGYAGVSEALQAWMRDHPMHAVLTRLGVQLRPEHFWGGAERLAAERGPAAAPATGPQPQANSASQSTPADPRDDRQLPASTFEFGISDDTDLFEAAMIRDEEEGAEEDEMAGATMEARIRHMKTGEKIKLAYVGNAESRMILIKDSNKVVAEAVLKSGRLSEREIVKVASMRSVADDVLRQVARNNEWASSYAVKLALVSNPKTPVAVSSRFLHGLNDRDVKLLSKNRNVNPAISQMAKKKIKAKEQKTKS
jgi:hypothetical protein